MNRRGIGASATDCSSWHTTIAAAVALCVVLTSASCVPVPTVPPEGQGTIRPGGVFVLCEGLWRQNNGALSYVMTGSAIRDVLPYVNGVKVGDTPTDMIAIGDTIVVAVNTSRKLLIVQRSTGRLLDTWFTPGEREPYRLATDGSRLWVTNLNDDSVTEFDLSTGDITVTAVPVGPAPEGIAVVNGKVYVAISGLGDLRASEAGAGTLHVMRIGDLQRVTQIAGIPNAGAVVADQARSRVWCAYRNLPSKTSELGGVALIDVRSDTIVQQWLFEAPTRIALDPASGSIYVLHQNGIDRLSAGDSSSYRVVSHSSAQGQDIWYALAFDPRNVLLVGNARSYVTDGEVLEYGLDGTVFARHPVAVNPTSILPAP